MNFENLKMVFIVILGTYNLLQPFVACERLL